MSKPASIIPGSAEERAFKRREAARVAAKRHELKADLPVRQERAVGPKLPRFAYEGEPLPARLRQFQGDKPC